MAFTKLTGTGHTANGVDYVSNLVDKPNDVGGLNADHLKAVFDQAGMEIQNYLNNTLTAELEAAGGANKIGIQTIGTIAATTIQGALEALYGAITEAHAPSDNSVTTAKIYPQAVTTDKLADNAVTAAKIKDGEVGENELAGLSVSTNKLQNGAVTADKLGAASVTAGKLASNAVGTDNLGDLLLPIAKGGTGATTADGAISQLGAQKAIQSNSFSLTTDGWTARSGGGFTKTVTVSGMTANKAFVASPSTEAAWKAAADAELYPPTAGDGTLTFTCENQPEAAITITVYFW